MMPLFLLRLTVLGLLAVGCEAKNLAEAVRPTSDKAHALALLNKQIAALVDAVKPPSPLSSSSGTKKKRVMAPAQLAESWRELGSLYQTKFLTYHEVGGGKQPRTDTLALRAYDTALEVAGDDPQMVAKVNLGKGILLKETGQGLQVRRRAVLRAALRCPALPCAALRCPALLCAALRCPALLCATAHTCHRSAPLLASPYSPPSSSRPSRPLPRSRATCGATTTSPPWRPRKQTCT